MALHLIDHPLAQVLITQLRNKTTPADAFRLASRRITQLLMIEATRTLRTRTVQVTTPLEETKGVTWMDTLTIIPIIRAGISMVEPIVDLFPHVVVGYVGLERDEDTAIAHNYYRKVPPLHDGRTFIVDPMLATGGSILQTLEICREEGAEKVTVVTIIASPEGVAAIESRFPDVEIYTASLDRELNQKKYILPGLGDFGDRLFNT
ncbi:MAG: uracil phosphoribosyltransferase [Verrucomicrobiae bacterium]|nr:uracil phosphoribosyltransferase [Verrucomicrobiae bacterium]